MKNKNLVKINLIYYISMIALAIVFCLGYLGILKNEFLSSFLIQIVVMFAMPLLLYTIFISKNAKTTFEDCGFKKISKKMLGITILLAIILYFINSFVATSSQSIIALFGYESIYTSETVTLDYAYLLKEFVLSAILPGFCEEFLHRGIMLFSAKKHTNTRFCLIVSSILFGLTHLNINQFFYATILGGMMGYVAIVADSIIPSMIIHFGNNFLSIYFAYGAYMNLPFATFVANLENALYSNALIFLLVSVCGVVLLVALYIYFTKRLLAERIKMNMSKLLDKMQNDTISLDDAKIKIAQINEILRASSKYKHLFDNSKKSPSFYDNIFLISSMVLSGIVTILSFVWGVL